MNSWRLCLFFVAVLGVGATEQSDAWQKLGTLERTNLYTIVLRDKSCQTGRIQTVESDKIILTTGATVQRSDVVWVGGGLSAHNILYSGRSSWDEVKRAQAASPESLTIRLRSGRVLTGPEISASDTGVTIKRFGRHVSTAKPDIAHVDYVRFKPVSEAHRYFAQEAAYLAVLDPKVWQYWLRIDALNLRSTLRFRNAAGRFPT